jgi:hypothetical protein
MNNIVKSLSELLFSKNKERDMSTKTVVKKKKKKTSPESIESEIRELAYFKWEKAGCPSTNEEERKEYWLEAEKEVMKIKTVSPKKAKSA